MKTQINTTSPEAATENPKLAAALPVESADFIDNATLLQRIPVSLGTIQNMRRAGKLPFVRLSGRRILYHWPTVRQALLRMQRGGTE